MKEKIKVDCENCIFYEQKIKEKDQRIAELEEENSKMKKKLENPHDVWVANNTLTEINNWQNGEISRLHEQLKNAIVLPKNFNLGQTVFMMPTDCNRLNKITAYTILDFSKSDIGLRADLSIVKKAKGVEPYFCAGFDMFNTIIFATEEEAKQHLEERN